MKKDKTSLKQSTEHHLAFEHERDMQLSREEAESSGPADISVCGEEDPGAALEYLVRKAED